MIEVILHTERNYRFLIDTDDRDEAIETATTLYSNGEDDIEEVDFNYENVVDIEANPY